MGVDNAVEWTAASPLSFFSDEAWMWQAAAGYAVIYVFPYRSLM
jgi:hypothetical protein